MATRNNPGKGKTKLSDNPRSSGEGGSSSANKKVSSTRGSTKSTKGAPSKLAESISRKNSGAGSKWWGRNLGDKLGRTGSDEDGQTQ